MVGEKIRDSRKKLNLSQEDLAGDNFTKSYISKIERGQVNPSMKALEVISSRLNLPVAYFISGKNNSSYDPRLVLEAHRLYELRKYSESMDKFNEVLNYRQHISRQQLIRIYYHITDICNKLGDYDICIVYCREAFDLIEKMESVYAVKIQLSLGEAFYYLNRRQESLDTFVNVEQMIKKHGLEIDIITKLELYNDIAVLGSQLGKTQLSEDYFRSIIDISKKEKIVTNNVLSAFAGLAQISAIYERDADKSLSYLDSDVLSLYKYFEDYNQLGGIYVKYANAYYEKDDMGKFKKYIDKLEEIIPLVDEVKSKNELDIYLTLYKGKLANSEGRHIEAESLMFTALEKCDEYEEPVTKTSVYLNLGDLYLNINKPDLSLEYLKKCEELAGELQYTLRLPELYRLMGKVCIRLGDVEKGQEYYDKAFKLLKEK